LKLANKNTVWLKKETEENMWKILDWAVAKKAELESRGRHMPWFTISQISQATGITRHQVAYAMTILRDYPHKMPYVRMHAFARPRKRDGIVQGYNMVQFLKYGATGRADNAPAPHAAQAQAEDHDEKAVNYAE
jgi:hypothetical protein